MHKMKKMKKIGILAVVIVLSVSGVFGVSVVSELPVYTDPNNQFRSAIFEDTIVFEDTRNGNWDIYFYIINQTSFFTIDFASIWLMFLVADIILKEKDLQMKEILSVKPVKKLDIFLGKFSTCFLSISLMIGIIFAIAWVGEIFAGFSPHFSTYLRNYIFDVLPMMAFSVALVILLSTFIFLTSTNINLLSSI